MSCRGRRGPASSTKTLAKSSPATLTYIKVERLGSSGGAAPFRGRIGREAAGKERGRFNPVPAFLADLHAQRGIAPAPVSESLAYFQPGDQRSAEALDPRRPTFLSPLAPFRKRSVIAAIVTRGPWREKTRKLRMGLDARLADGFRHPPKFAGGERSRSSRRSANQFRAGDAATRHPPGTGVRFVARHRRFPRWCRTDGNR